ncbi:MAG: LysE family translocator [Bacteroidales bacterium]|nr:LysE family translocator [Bacteroidales bacterium]MCL2132847.1 LysE family translocator [Bacteroidales bacterium]
MTLIKGILVGLGASIPLGPIGVLCVQRTLSKGRLSGFISGMGAAFADTIFAVIAIMGLAVVLVVFEANRNLFLIIGGFIVVAIGLKIYFTNPIKQIRQKRRGRQHLFEDFISVAMLTFSNPGALFLVLGLLALVGLNIDSESSYLSITLALCGVLIGATLWWFILSTLISLYRRRFRIKQLWIINRVAGIVIVALGFISIIDGLYELVKQLMIE